jgi:hypothetical protein
MPTLTRKQLRTRHTASTDLTNGTTFTLTNNVSKSVYFNIEGSRYYISESGVFDGYKHYDIFNTASLDTLVNCSVITGSLQAGFVVDPGAVATFNWATTTTVPQENVTFMASNGLVRSGSTPSGSVDLLYGVQLDY